MQYFDGLHFLGGDHVPRCSVKLRLQGKVWALNFAESGTFRWTSSTGRERLLSCPVAYWTWPGRTFVYGCRAHETWNQRYILFHGPRVQRMVGRGLLTKSETPWRAVHHAQAFADRFDCLLQMTQDAGQPEKAVHGLEGLLLDLHMPGPAASLQQNEPIRDLAQAIQETPADAWRVDAMAEAVGVSTVHLRRLFHDVLGLSPQRFVTRCRMQQAAERLAKTDRLVRQVAIEVGYEDPFHFSKTFRQTYGLSPSRYRQDRQQFSHKHSSKPYRLT
jgi:AraC-like DNA-binding protein